MAFCTRSERNINLIQKDTNPLGPGEYIKLSKKHTHHNRKHIPFNTCYPKTSTKTDKPSPGPGAYNPYNNSQSNLLDSTAKSSTFTSSSAVIDKNINQNNPTKLGFLTKTERFTPDPNAYLPGPGAYLTSSLPDIKQSNNNNNNSNNALNNSVDTLLLPVNNSKLKAMQFKTGLPQRIISIPSKKMNGYYLDKNSDQCEIIIDPLSFEEYHGSTSCLVGPGSYENMQDKRNNAVKWSNDNDKHSGNKVKQKKAEEEKEMKLLYDDTSSSSNSNNNRFKRDNVNSFRSLKNTNNKHSGNSSNSNKMNFHSVFQQRIQNEKIMKELHSIMKEPTVEELKNLIINDTPGPGFYQKEFTCNQTTKTSFINSSSNNNNNLLNNHKAFLLSKYNINTNNNQTQQHFGSKEIRFLTKSKSTQNISPCSYFMQKNKYEPNPKDKNYYKGVHTKTISSANTDLIDFVRFTNIAEKTLVGPGSYNISRSFVEPNICQREPLNQYSERFSKSVKSSKDNNGKGSNMQTPGPGSYLSQDIISKEMKVEKPKAQDEYYYDPVDIIKDKQKHIKQQLPGVGNYHPEIVYSIEYRNSKKHNPAQSVKCGFLTSATRFQRNNFNTTNEFVGPSYYNPYDKQITKSKSQMNNHLDKGVINSNSNNSNIAFGSTDRRFESTSSNSLGPGEYNVGGSTWNKKSYNILFCQQQLPYKSN